ncbi:MAG: right-handed parallel beta-helix repeat-containing protein [Candidatus Paceibacterota bacterium]
MHRLLIALLLPILLGASPPSVLEGDTQTFLGPIKVVGEIYRWLDSVLGTATLATVAPITLYVETTGNDSNDCLSVSTACLTIQEAINRIPKNIGHTVSITVGSGNFAGFVVSGFIVTDQNQFSVQGTLGAYSPATGLQTGVADGAGGSTEKLVDSDGGWTVNNLKGSLLKIGTEYRFIRDNTATEIEVVGAFSATCNGKTYEIVESKTVITSNASVGSARVYITANVARSGGIRILNLKSSGGTYGFFADGTSGTRFQYLHAYGFSGVGFINQFVDYATIFDIAASAGTGTSYGIFISHSHMSSVGRMFSFSSTGAYGIRAYSTSINSPSYWVVYDLTGTSVYGIALEAMMNMELTGTNRIKNITGSTSVYGAGFYSGAYYKISGTLLIDTITKTGAVDLTTGIGLYQGQPCDVNLHNITVTNCTSHGISATRSTSIMLVTASLTNNDGYGLHAIQNSNIIFRNGTQTVSGNALGGVYAGTSAKVLLDNTDGSNTGYGITVEQGARVTIDSGTGITGTTNNILLDDVEKTYAGDFAVNKDTEIGVYGSVVQRYDGLDFM